MTFPKPGQTRKKREPVKYPDGEGGREVIDTSTAEGKRLWRARTIFVWVSHGNLCGICGKWVELDELTGDHINPRGMGGGKRDDRIKNLQPAHFSCNAEKGSKRL